MSMAMTAFVEFLHEHTHDVRVIYNCENLFNLAHAIHQAENVGLVLDPDSVIEACKLILEG